MAAAAHKLQSTLAALWRVRLFVQPYRWRLYAGITAFGVARLLEALVPVLTAVAINKMADGDYRVDWQVMGIVRFVSLHRGLIRPLQRTSGGFGNRL